MKAFSHFLWSLWLMFLSPLKRQRPGGPRVSRGQIFVAFRRQGGRVVEDVDHLQAVTHDATGAEGEPGRRDGETAVERWRQRWAARSAGAGPRRVKWI